ncbi:acyl carrier protein [Chromobacterium sphagni]|uniref:Carrier domain-containing protein n=1 Tax=Chromobacterium sphagni TaxID=1903179 RepID=A0A1S1X272_9NEIS|nr:acyl carrier protein [Chromobacterium sphagni]OHX13490.1 hypothetical protein BI347_08175 [Chromobacterium sphagni]OHX21946.1 hypothetical protein BI344_05465 [Chromobacterium sphagni]
MFDLICNVLRENAERGILPTHLATSELDPDTLLPELGIDSLGVMTLISELCGRLGIEPLDLAAFEHSSLEELAGLLQAATAPQLQPVE